MKKIILIVFLASSTACTTTVGQGWNGEGRVLLAADERGMEAFSDMIQGTITNGKASPDTDTGAWETRRQQIKTWGSSILRKPRKVKPAK